MEQVRQGQVAEAIRTFEAGLKSEPQNPVLLDATGAAYSLEGDYERATGYFLASLREKPGFLPARKNLAITYFNEGQYELAATEFQTLASSPGPSRKVASLFLGMIAEKNGDYAKAVSFFGQAGELLSRYPEALLCSANAELQLKQAEKAEAALKTFDAHPGATAAEKLQASQLYLQLGKNNLALADVEAARKKDSGLEGIEYQRAVVLDRMERSQEALQILKDLVITKPDAEALNLLAHVAQKDGDLALAMQSLKQAAKLDPDREENYLDFSTICADNGNYPLALEAADIGLGHIPNSYRLQVQKGVVLENLGRLEEAEEELRNASRLQKDNSVALLSLAIVENNAGQLQDAETTLTAAIRDFPDNYYMHYFLGKVLLQIQEGMPADAGMEAKAKQAFQQAIRLNPSFADSYYQLSKLYLRESPKLAEQYLVKCLRADPNHAPAEYTLARLYLNTGRRAAGQAMIDRFESLQKSEKLKEQQKPRIESAQN
jgi:tetratricopeptide (TPR) repeat protein